MQWTPDHLQCALIPLRSFVQTEICPIDVVGANSTEQWVSLACMTRGSIQLGGKWPFTTPQMTIHYSTQSKAYRRKQSSWNCIACHHSLHPEWAKDLRFAQTGFGVYWLWICLLLSAFPLTSFLQFFFQSIQYSTAVQCRVEQRDGRPLKSVKSSINKNITNCKSWKFYDKSFLFPQFP